MTRLLNLLVALAAIATLGATATATATVGATAAASAPTATTGTTGTITETTATLGGTVTPNGSATTYYFQWGPTTAFGTTGPARSAGAGSKPVIVRTTAAGLTPGTVYHYRVVATNALGTTTGGDVAFTTQSPADVITGPAVNLGKSDATLTGTVNPRGTPTTWTFEYGTTASYGVETFTRPLPAVTSPVSVAVTLHGLEPGRIFHYRLVARHTGSGSTTSSGIDQRFMTFPSPRLAPRVRAVTSRRRTPARRYVLATTGHIGHPGWIPGAFACSGKITISTFLGTRRVGYALAPVNPDCTFTGRTAFARRPGPGPAGRTGELRVRIRFSGNSYLAAAVAPPQLISLA